MLARLTHTWGAVQAVAYGVVPVLLIGALSYLVVTEMRRDDLEVAPIQVPARLAEAGMSPEVTAHRLVDHIFAAESAARSDILDRPHIELAGEMPDFSVPIAGLSLRSLATLLRTVLGSPPRRISGEIVIEADKLKLRLRLAGHRRIADIGGFGIDQVDALLAAAAPEVWREISPRSYAWHVAQSEPNENKVRERLGRMLQSEASPDTRQTLQMLIGRSFVRSSRGGDAFAVLDELTRASPGYGLAWYWRGRAQRLLGRVDAALADYQQALALDAKAFWVHVGLSELLRDKGDLEGAMREVRLVLAQDDDDPGALAEQAAVLLMMGRTDEALASARLSLVGDPGNPMAHRIIGRALMAQGKLAEALAAFDDALKHAPLSVDSRVWRAEALARLGRRAEVNAALLSLSEFGPLPARLEAVVTRLRAAQAGPEAGR